MLRVLLISLLIALCPLSAAYAHPHVYIDVTLEVTVDGTGISSIRQNWLFVGDYGKQLARDGDTNGDGEFDTRETDTLVRSYLLPLSSSRYCTVINVDGHDYFAQSVGQPEASVVNGRLSLSFTMPVTIPAAGNTRVAVRVYDETRYIDFAMRDYAILKAGGGVEVQAEDAFDFERYSVATRSPALYLSIRMTRHHDSVQGDAAAGAPAELGGLEPAGFVGGLAGDNPFASAGSSENPFYGSQ